MNSFTIYCAYCYCYSLCYLPVAANTLQVAHWLASVLHSLIYVIIANAMQNNFFFFNIYNHISTVHHYNEIYKVYVKNSYIIHINIQRKSIWGVSVVG